MALFCRAACAVANGVANVCGRLCAALCALLLCAAACSTPPKNAGEVHDLRRQAETQLELGNRQADRGSYETAFVLLGEARRLAVAVDSPSLRIRAELSRGNVLFSLGRREEARADWQNSLGEAERAGLAEFAAVSRIHLARGRLLAADDPAAVARSVRDEVGRELGSIKTERLYTAFAWQVSALAEREMGRYADAEAAVKRCLEIHEKDRRFEQSAYDWFLIASFRSLAGNYPGAAQALELAIAADRRVENSWGLAADWRALGDVWKKAGKADESRRAYLRAAEIFRALGNAADAQETEKRLNAASE